MARIKIKQLGSVIGTSGVHMGGGPERRKLEPGEVVEIPEDLLMKDGRPLLGALYETDRIELTPEPVTRPLDFANVREAKLTSTNFKPRSPDEEREQELAHAAVELRVQDVRVPAPVTEPEPAPKQAAPGPTTKKASTRRQRRRETAERGKSAIA